MLKINIFFKFSNNFHYILVISQDKSNKKGLNAKNTQMHEKVDI
jgi:hypothetical protein